LHVFAVNRNVDEAAAVVIDVPGHTFAGSVAAQLVTGPGAKASNSFAHQDVVVPVAFHDVLIEGGSARFELPPLAFAAISLTR
jgi:alpha-L-arabinofuranosidase